MTSVRSESWALVHRQLKRTSEALEEAKDVEELQAVGVLCRETLISLAQSVYVPDRHKSLDGIPPSKTDFKRMLEAYISVELSGGSNKDTRGLAKSTFDLANNLQHSRTADHHRAAMCVSATTCIVDLIKVTALRAESRSTVAKLCERYILESNPKASHRYTLQSIANSALGKKIASELQPRDILDYCKQRRKKVAAATVTQDLTYLRGVFEKAEDKWNLNVSRRILDELKPQLEKTNLTGRSTPRTRLPTADELSRLRDYFARQARSEIPMMDVSEFALRSARRVSEICDLRWGDVDFERKSCSVRISGPRSHLVRTHNFPLLGRAWDLVMQQPRLTNSPDERIFPYRAKSVSASYARAKKELGITNLRLHDLRREAARLLLEEGHPLESVLKVVGRIDVAPLLRELGIS